MLLAIIGCSTTDDPTNLKINESIFAISGSADRKYERSLLNDSINNEIVKWSIEGIDSVVLHKRNIPDPNNRITELYKGNLIQKINGRYYPSFPIFTGERRSQLQKIARKEADKLVPYFKDIIIELESFGIEKDQLFHMIWSRIMDDRTVWDGLWEIKNPGKSFPYVFWVVHPFHPFACGTNYYIFVEGDMAISWGPGAKDQLELIPRLKHELFKSSIGRTINDPKSRSDFEQIGMIDNEGLPKFKVLLKNDTLTSYCHSQSIKYYKLIDEKVDFRNPFDSLFVSDSQYFVILLHEISYNILEHLRKEEIITFPLAQPNNKDLSNVVSVLTEIPKDLTDEVMALYQLNGWRGNDEIAKEFERVAEADPEDYSYLFFYGLTLFDIGNHERSIEVFRSFISKSEHDEPNLRLYDWSHIWIAHNYDLSGNREKAIEYYNHVLNFRHESGNMQMTQYKIRTTTAREWARKRIQESFSTEKF